MGENLKKCTKCSNIKPTSAFSKKRASRDGLYCICKQCDQEDGRQRYRRTVESRALTEKKEHINIYNRVVDGYGGKCEMCGCEEHWVFMLHHREGGGAKHVRSLPGSQKLYRWAIKNNFPRLLMLVCANCHMLIHRAQCGYFCDHNINLANGDI